MKIVRKILFWIVAVMVTMFIGVWSVATASHMHIGEEFPNAVVSGFSDAADGVGELLGIKDSKVNPDIVLDFKNGEIGFSNTHISW